MSREIDRSFLWEINIEMDDERLSGREPNGIVTISLIVDTNKLGKNTSLPTILEESAKELRRIIKKRKAEEGR